MTCRPQLKVTGIFRPRVKLQNNKQKVRLSNSGSGGVNPKGRSVKAKGLKRLEMQPWCRRSQSLLPQRASLKWGSVATAGVETTKWREHACNRRITGWGNSDTSGVNKRKEKQKVRREPEAQPGRGTDQKVGGEKRESDTLNGNHTPSLLTWKLNSGLKPRRKSSHRTQLWISTSVESKEQVVICSSAASQ